MILMDAHQSSNSLFQRGPKIPIEMQVGFLFSTVFMRLQMQCSVNVSGAASVGVNLWQFRQRMVS